MWVLSEMHSVSESAILLSYDYYIILLGLFIVALLYIDYLFDTAITWTTDGANAGTVNYRDGKFYSTNVNGVLLSNQGYANQCNAEVLNMIAWRFVSKVGNPKLMNNIMSEILIVIPQTIEEQLVISDFFRTLDTQITTLTQKLHHLRTLKSAYLQKMFV